MSSHVARVPYLYHELAKKPNYGVMHKLMNGLLSFFRCRRFSGMPLHRAGRRTLPGPPA